MSVEDPLPEMILKYMGVFDLDKLFHLMYEWFIQQGYELTEGKYKHKIPTPKGAEQDIDWMAKRKVTHYIMYQIKINFRLWDLKDVEVVKGDEKKTLAFAKLKITFNPTLVLDYENKFKGKFLGDLHKFFIKLVYNQELDNVYGDQLYYRVYKLHQAIKEHLDMETTYNASEGRW